MKRFTRPAILICPRRAAVAILLVVAWCASNPPPAAHAEARTWTDPAGDVTLANADIVSGSATVSGGMVDLRVAFAAPPFPTTATHTISWCFDTDQNAATGSTCGSSDLLGADRGFSLFGSAGALTTCVFGLSGNVPIDVPSELWYDPATYTVRLLFPLSLLCDEGGGPGPCGERGAAGRAPVVFNYAVESAFGGSFGANDRVPNSANFGSGRFLTSDVGRLPPFPGTLLCPDDAPRRLASPLGRPAVDIRSEGPVVRGGRATLELSLTREAHVDVALYDMLGRHVATLDHSRRIAGSHRVSWDTAAFAPGMYFYRVRAGDALLSKPVLILR